MNKHTMKKFRNFPFVESFLYEIYLMLSVAIKDNFSETEGFITHR